MPLKTNSEHVANSETVLLVAVSDAEPNAEYVS